MRQVSTWIAWAVTALVAALLALNWTTLTASAPLDLVVAQVQAPLGVVMLGLTAVLVALFLVAYLRNQISALIETRRLLKEIQRVQDLATKADESRIENLHRLIATEFRLLNERLNSSASVDHAASAEQTDRPLSLTDLVTRREPP
jgi:uncharacterized integral membrane protein